MNILYYIPELNQATGGSRQYSIAMLELLAKDRTNNQYLIFHNSEDRQVLDIVEKSTNMLLIPTKLGKEKRHQKFFRHFISLLNILFIKFGAPSISKGYYFLNRVCKKYKVDIVFFPGQYNSLIKGPRKICTVHDVQELHFPDYFTPEERRDRAIGMVNKLHDTNLVIVSFNHVKKDLTRFFQVPNNRILVCLLDMSNLWFKKFEKMPQSDIPDIKLPEKFLLYPANTWRHKNHITLLETIAYLRDKKDININLVCTGDKNSFFADAILPKMKELNLEGQVVFLGVVSEEVLFSLYKKCWATVIPTIYEAGSFPLIESILIGVPVVCSSVTSLPETIGDMQFTFNPFDVADMADKIQKIFTSEEYRASNIYNSKLQSAAILDTGSLEKMQEAFKIVAAI